jgi:hypothetical protein
MKELERLAEILMERHKVLSVSPSSGGNPTVALQGALIAIKEVVEAIHFIRANPCPSAGAQARSPTG